MNPSVMVLNFQQYILSIENLGCRAKMSELQIYRFSVNYNLFSSDGSRRSTPPLSPQISLCYPPSPQQSSSNNQLILQQVGYNLITISSPPRESGSNSLNYRASHIILDYLQALTTKYRHNTRKN